MTGAEGHMLTSNSWNGSERKDQGNWIGKAQSNEKPEHDQQGKEKYAKKKDLMQAKWPNCDKMGHHTCDCTEPKKVYLLVTFVLLVVFVILKLILYGLLV